jgi:hypothetical protein
MFKRRQALVRAVSRAASSLYDPEAAEYAKLRDAAAAERRAIGLREEKPAYYIRQYPICPAKAYRYHPDASVRELAKAQAAESHAVHGCCKGRAKTSLSQFCKNDTTLYLSLKKAEAQRTNAKMKGN